MEVGGQISLLCFVTGAEVQYDAHNQERCQMGGIFFAPFCFPLHIGRGG